MTDNVANLGFAVDSKPLDDTKQKLDSVTSSAKQTEDQARKTSAALGNVGGNPQNIKNTANAVEDLANSLVKAARASNDSFSLNKIANEIVGKTGVAYSQAAAAVQAANTAYEKLNPALRQTTPAVNEAAQAIRGKTAALSDFDRAILRMGPVLNQFQGGLGATLGASNALRFGLGGLAVVAGGAVVVGMAKLNDEVVRTNKFFEALTGSSKAGQAALDAVKKTARETGVDQDMLAKALDRASQGMAMFGEKSVFFSNVGSNNEANVNKLNGALNTLAKVIRLSAGDAEEAGQIFATAFSSVQKTGTLTAEAFQKIRDISLPTAVEIARIFGRSDINAFQQELEKTPITIEQLIRAMSRIKTGVDEAFGKSDRIRSFDEQLGEVKQSWNEFKQAVGESGAFQAAIGIINVLKAAVIGLGGAVQTVAPLFRGASTSDLTSNFNGITGTGSGGQDIQAPPPSSSGGSGSGTVFVGGGGASGGGGSSGGGTVIFNDTVEGGFGEPGAAGFASGGSFVVGGDGGTDTTPVSFMATKGEIVTIETPDQAGVGSLTPTTDTGTNKVLSVLEKIKTAVSKNDLLSQAVNLAIASANKLNPTGAATATSAAASAASTLGLSGGGGGGFNTRNNNDEQKAAQERAARERELGGGVQSSGGGLPFNLVSGQGVPVGSGRSYSGGGITRRSLPERSPIGPLASNKPVVIEWPKGERSADETTRAIDTTNLTLDELQRTSMETTKEVDSSGQETVGAVNASSDSITGAITGLGSALSSLASAFTGGAFASGGGSSSGGGGGAGSASPSSYGGGDYSSGGSVGGGSGADFATTFGGGGGDYSGGGSSFDESGFTSDLGVGGDGGYGGGSEPMAFASGGQFRVGGRSGLDKTRVSFLATRGETVTVTPPGISVPRSMLNPSSGVSASAGVTHRSTTKNVNIYVNPGMQAEQFLRSRAQIARAM